MYARSGFNLQRLGLRICLYICMYVCMYVCIYERSAFDIHCLGLRACLYTCRHAFVRMCLCACMPACRRHAQHARHLPLLHTRVLTKRVCTCARARAREREREIEKRARKGTQTHTHTHTHTHTGVGPEDDNMVATCSNHRASVLSDGPTSFIHPSPGSFNLPDGSRQVLNPNPKP